MLLLLHVAAGTAALAVGPFAVAGARRAVPPYRALVVTVGSAVVHGLPVRTAVRPSPAPR